MELPHSSQCSQCSHSGPISAALLVPEQHSRQRKNGSALRWASPLSVHLISQKSCTTHTHPQTSTHTTHAHTPIIQTHPLIPTFMHTRNNKPVHLSAEVMLKPSLRNSKIQISKQISLSYMPEPMFLKVLFVIWLYLPENKKKTKQPNQSLCRPPTVFYWASEVQFARAGCTNPTPALFSNSTRKGQTSTTFKGLYNQRKSAPGFFFLLFSWVWITSIHSNLHLSLPFSLH